MLKALTSSLISLFTVAVMAHPVERSENQKFTFEPNENHSQISEADVRTLFYILESEFGSEIQNPSKSISESFNWLQPYMGAGALMIEGNFTIMLWGGMVRAPFMNYGALLSVLCHEVGHRLGGSPHQKLHESAEWSSAEGQSDHFAATVCLPQMYQRLQKEWPQYLAQEIEPSSQEICRNSNRQAQCQWVATSGIDMIQFLQVYYERDIPFADPLKSPKEKVPETLHSRYPSYQCRMEIFKAGSQCHRGLSCPRQACWYKAP